MKKLLTTLAVLTAVAVPAVAQAQRYHRNRAYEYLGDGAHPYVSGHEWRNGVPSANDINEEERLDHAKGEIE